MESNRIDPQGFPEDPIDREEVTRFFDALAPDWDNRNRRNDAVISSILDSAGVHGSSRVLDVACGTGVLIPDLLARGVSEITAVDISPAMIQRLTAKFSDCPAVHPICSDILTYETEQAWDCVLVYNALPHLGDIRRLLHRLQQLTVSGGSITIAHGAGRDSIDRCHAGLPQSVSAALPEIDTLVGMLPEGLQCTAAVSNEKMYLLTARKR